MPILYKRVSRTFLPVICTFFAVLLLSACDRGTVYHSFHPLSEDGWNKKDTLCFDMQVADSQTSYRLYVELRYRDTYPYRNLSLLVDYLTPDSVYLQTGTLQMMLADDAGVWLGEGLNGLYQCSFSAGIIPVNKPGQYRILLTYAFPDSVLPGISDVGIRVNKSR